MVVSTQDDDAEPEIPQQLLDRLQPEQRASFLLLWNDGPPHLRHNTFNLDGEGWTPAVIDKLQDVLIRYSARFSTSPLDLGRCTTTPFKIDVPKGTPLIPHDHIAQTRYSLLRYR